jgi:hypothetical protein
VVLVVAGVPGRLGAAVATERPGGVTGGDRLPGIGGVTIADAGLLLNLDLVMLWHALSPYAALAASRRYVTVHLQFANWYN